MAEVTTVLGQVDASELGVVLAHEHLFIDLSCLWHKPRDPKRNYMIDARVEEIERSALSRDPYHCKDNLLLEDVELAVNELSLFKNAGGGTLVDLSTRDIGPYPEKLAVVARHSGVHVIAGTGFYTKRAHPDYVAKSSVRQLAEQMINELKFGFGDSDIRAGVIGELGSSSPLHEDEMKVLRAAVLAHSETGAGINVHLAIFSQEGHRVLDILEAEGMDLSRVALSHLDEFPDFNHHLSLAERGCFVEFDCFGSEVHFDEDELREPTDSERIDALLALIREGHANRLLLSQDVCTKMQLRNYGGRGYDHIMKSVVPLLLEKELDDLVLKQMLVHNPVDFLVGKS